MFSFFEKPEFKEIIMPFKYVESRADLEAGFISIIAYGEVLGKMKYCYATFGVKDVKMYDNGEYEELINLLKNNIENKKVKVMVKIKDGKAKDFKIDLTFLAEVYSDNRFNKLDLLGCGIHDKEPTNL